mgnify:CR=1 FL=1
MAFKINAFEKQTIDKFLPQLRKEIKKYFLSRLGKNTPDDWLNDYALVSRTIKEEIDRTTHTFVIRFDFAGFTTDITVGNSTVSVTVPSFFVFVDLYSSIVVRESEAESTRLKMYEATLSEVDSAIKIIMEKVGDFVRKKERELGV